MMKFISTDEGIYMKRTVFSILTFLVSSAIVIAQGNQCPVMEQAAVSEARAWCTDLSLGLACYGNSNLTADILSDATFGVAGDRIALTDITQITSMIDTNRYGVALIHTSGYSPNSWIQQDVTLAILGDVTISNTGNENINLVTLDGEIVGDQGANIRSGPTTDYRVLTSLFAGDIVKITGRTQDDSFYRVQLPSGQTGWVASGAIADDVSDLPIVTVDDPAPEPIYAPYTSFSLTTATEDAGCIDAWESGVLLQSPENESVRIVVNDIEIVLTGTIFLQADEITTYFYVLEGEIIYEDESIVEGYQLVISEDDRTIAPYDSMRFAPLPTQILPRYTYIGIELATIITPAPTVDRSPIADVLVDDPCVITTGEGGANLRSGPGSEFPIRGVFAFRETANPISRVIGSNGLLWYELAQNVWVTSQVVVTGGDCLSVPQAQRLPVPIPTATPEN